MSLRPALVLQACIAALASAGMVAAHRVAYAVGEVNVHHAEALSIGHRYLPYVLAAALGLLVLASARYLFLELSSLHAPPRPLDLYRLAALRLVAIQTVGFVALELGERVLLGISPRALLGESVLTLGIVAQAIVALVGAFLFAVFTHGLATVIQRTRRRDLGSSGDRSGSWPRERSTWLGGAETAGSITLRGPPLQA